MLYYDALINCAPALEHCGDPNWLFIDCRYDLNDPEAGWQQYLQSHLPGAIYFHLDRDLCTVPGRAMAGGRHPLPAREDICHHFASRGIGDDMQIIIYDSDGGIFASRLWWMLRWVGHEAVAILNGGFPMWQSLGMPLQSGKVQEFPTQLTLGECAGELILVETVKRNMHSRVRTLIDARAPERFYGHHEPIDKVAGHIPGARNWHYKNNLNPDGTFKSPLMLRDVFDRLTLGRPSIHQCGSGITACHNMVAMTYAGVHPGGLYAGSWSEWIEDPTRPISRR